MIISGGDISGILQAGWEQGKCPIANGIIYATGTIACFNLSVRRIGGKNAVALSRGGIESLASLAAVGRLEWTHVTEMCSDESVQHGVRAVGGEGGMGSEGFVALIELQTNRICWIMCFEESNPFSAVRVLGDLIIAESTLGHKWTIPIKDPEKVRTEIV